MSAIDAAHVLWTRLMYAYLEAKEELNAEKARADRLAGALRPFEQAWLVYQSANGEEAPSEPIEDAVELISALDLGFIDGQPTEGYPRWWELFQAAAAALRDAPAEETP